MKNSITKVSCKGQIVVPKDMRKKLEIKDGDAFVVVNYNNMIVLKKVEHDLDKDEKHFLERIGDKVEEKTDEKVNDKENSKENKQEEVVYRSYIH